MNKQTFFIALLCILSFSACQKNDSVPFDSSKLVMTISEPLATQIFKKGDTVFIAATANYLSELHGYEISIVDTTTQNVYFDIDEHVHAASFSIDTFWVDTLNTNTKLQLKFDVEADHDGHGATKSVFFQVQ
jgi:hypothetical protein